METKPLKDKVAVITGASRGLGKAMALEFARAGAKVVAAARPSDNLENVVEQIKVERGEATAIPTDVTDPVAVTKLGFMAEQTYDGIDVWVNNAGAFHREPLNCIEDSAVHGLFAVNTFSAIYGCKVAALYMNAKGGRIINIVSTAGLVGKPMESLYCATKFAVSGLSKALDVELAQESIRVSAVYPGGMKTDFFPDQISTEGYMDPAGVAKQVMYLAAAPKDMVVTDLVIQRNTT